MSGTDDPHQRAASVVVEQRDMESSVEQANIQIFGTEVVVQEVTEVVVQNKGEHGLEHSLVEAETAKIFDRILAELGAEEARADRLLRLYNL